MRIAFVIDRYRPGKGGLERWLEALCHRLVGRDHDVHLVSADRDAAGPFTHHPIGSRRLLRHRRDRAFAERAKGLVRETAFDRTVGLRHCLACDVYAPHGGSVAAGIEAHRLAGRRPSLPSAKIRTFLALERELLTGPLPPRRILAVSEMVRRDLTSRYPAVEDRIRVVPNGVDLERFSPDLRGEARARLAPRGERIVLFLASNPRLKGWSSVKRVFGELRGRGGADLLLAAGGDPGRMPEGGRYLGRLERPEQALAAADLLLLPTFYDPFPLVVLEALACGTPVATTEQDGALDHVGRQGPVRAANDPGDIVELTRIAKELLEVAPRAEARAVALRFSIESSLGSAEALIVEDA